MIQPVEGLVVSIPVLVQVQCMERQAPEAHRSFVGRVTAAGGSAPRADIATILDLLGYYCLAPHTIAVTNRSLS